MGANAVDADVVTVAKETIITRDVREGDRFAVAICGIAAVERAGVFIVGAGHRGARIAIFVLVLVLAVVIVIVIAPVSASVLIVIPVFVLTVDRLLSVVLSAVPIVIRRVFFAAGILTHLGRLAAAG